MSKFDSQPATNGIAHGLDPKHLAFPWFRTLVMGRLEHVFQQPLKLVFAMYLDISSPFGIHSDIRPCDGEPYVSCLIPVSVDHDPDLCHLATTDVYQEVDTGGLPPNNPTLAASYTWQRGDLIWWHTPVYHTSGAFDGFSSKQSIVVHTYV
jgi:hypothetical protein